MMNARRLASLYRRLPASVRALSLASAVALAGCMSLAPPYQQPALPVPATFPGATGNGAGASAAETGWHDYFADPELRELITTALDNNRDLRLAMQRVEEARALYGIRRADQLPTLGVEADLARQRVPADVSGVGRAVTASQYTVGVGIATWELDFWGRVANLREAALQNYLASDAAREAVQLTLIEQVANTYLALRELDERLALTHETIASREQSYRIFSRRYQVGAISKLDLTQVETLWRQALALGTELEQAREQQANGLQLLVGAPVDVPPAAAKLDDNAVMRDLPAGLPSDLLTNRPDIVAAEYQLRAANANIGSARAEFFPRITLTGAFGTASTQLSGLFSGPNKMWSFGPSVSLPIFDRGRRSANLAAVTSQRDQAITSYEQAIQSAFRDVADALARRGTIDAQVTADRNNVEHSLDNYRLTDARYKGGIDTFLDSLIAQRSLYGAQRAYVATELTKATNLVDLYTALGGDATLDATADGPRPTAPEPEGSPIPQP